MLTNHEDVMGNFSSQDESRKEIMDRLFVHFLKLHVVISN
jgi:hypothetical protein